MNFNVNVGVGAVFKLVVRKADTDEIVHETPEFHNLVLTTGLARMAVGTWIDRCCVGTGNSNPVASQVALDSFLASTTTTATGASNTGGIQVTTAPFYWFGRSIWRFAVGVATGNISEIGLGWGNSNLWNRALVKDIEGNPTTITVLADEYLDVISEVRVYPKESTGSFNLVDKLGAVISEHTYKTQPYIYSNGSNAGAHFIATGIKFGNVGNGYNSFHISDAAMPISVNNPITAKFSKNANTQETNIAGIAIKTIVTSSEAIFTHRSFQAQISGLMSWVSNNGGTSSGLGYKWEINLPIPKDAETILTYSFTLAWGNYVPE